MAIFNVPEGVSLDLLQAAACSVLLRAEDRILLSFELSVTKERYTLKLDGSFNFGNNTFSPNVASLQTGTGNFAITFPNAKDPLTFDFNGSTINAGQFWSALLSTDDWMSLGARNDSIILGAGDDYVNGGAGNDALTGGAGNDLLDGGSGRDVARFTGSRFEYGFATANGRIVVTDRVAGRDDVDTLVNVERAQFRDGVLAFDVSGTAGQAYRLYQAAFARTPDVGGLGFQTRELDERLTLSQVANNFIASPEFQNKYGVPSQVSSDSFVNLLYQNVLGRGPDASGLAFHLNNLGRGLSRADLLVQFSESPENQANVQPSIDAGVWFV